MAFGITDWWNKGPGSFINDSIRNTGNFVGSIGDWITSNQSKPGQGLGDRLVGPAPNKPSTNAPTMPGIVGRNVTDTWTPEIVKKLTQPYNPPAPQMQNTPLPSYQDALAQAAAMMKSSGFDPGYVDVNAISWNPLRNEAKSRQSDYDAKVASMYAALTNDVRTKDAQAIKQNFADNLSDVKGSTKDAVSMIQDASRSADQANMENLAALGLGDAAARIVESGRDVNSDTAQNVANAVAQGQSAENAVNRKEQASSDYNTQMAGAYGLQGAEARDALKMQLAQVLAGYDMDEQQARLAATSQNQQRQAQAQSQMYQLAQQILGNNWQQVQYNDSLSQAQAQMMQQAAQAQQEAAAKAEQAQQVQSFLQQMLTSGQKPGDIAGWLPFLYGKQ